MRIVFTSKGTEWESDIDPRFGRTDYLFLYDDEKDEVVTEDNTAVREAAHGAGPQTAKKLFDMQPDVLVTGNGPGGNAAAVLEKSKVKIYTGAENMTLREAYDAYKKGSLNAL